MRSSMRMRFERLCLVLIAALTVFVIAGHYRRFFASSGYIPDDFGAFYCAGDVVLHHEDPYRLQPMLQCERGLVTLDPGWKTTLSGAGVLPVPYPGYDFLPLAALAALPVRLSAILFGALLLGATVLIAYCLSRMSALPFVAAFAVAFMGVTYRSATFDQLAPLAVAATAGAAFLLRAGKLQSAVLTSSVALLQPQFGVPILAAMFVFIPRVRLLIFAICVMLFLLTIAAIGVHETLEYVSVLPIHTGAEVSAARQYSLTWLLRVFGEPERIALAGGTIWSILMLTVCLIVLARSGEAAIKTGAVVLLPAAFATFGGTFVHDHQISVALLPAIALVQPVAAVPMLGAALLTVPFGEIRALSGLPSLLLTVAAVWCVVFFPMRAASSTQAAIKSATVIAALVSTIVVTLLLIRPVPTPNVAIEADRQPNVLASVEWRRSNEIQAQHDRTPLLYYVLLKAPTWGGITLTLVFSCALLLSTTETRVRRGPLPAAKAVP